MLELKPDLTIAASHFILEFRKGKFGRILLDDVGSNTELRNNFRIINPHRPNERISLGEVAFT